MNKKSLHLEEIMSRDTKVSLRNGGKSGVASAEDRHMREDCVSEKGHKSNGALWQHALQKPS